MNRIILLISVFAGVFSDSSPPLQYFTPKDGQFTLSDITKDLEKYSKRLTIPAGILNDYQTNLQSFKDNIGKSLFNFGYLDQNVKPVQESNTEPPPPKGIFGNLGPQNVYGTLMGMQNGMIAGQGQMGANIFGQVQNVMQGQNGFGQGQNSFGQGQNSFGQGQNSFGQAQNSFGQGQNSFGQGQNVFGQTQNGFGQSAMQSQSVYPPQNVYQNQNWQNVLAPNLLAQQQNAMAQNMINQNQQNLIAALTSSSYGQLQQQKTSPNNIYGMILGNSMGSQNQQPSFSPSSNANINALLGQQMSPQNKVHIPEVPSMSLTSSFGSNHNLPQSSIDILKNAKPAMLNQEEFVIKLDKPKIEASKNEEEKVSFDFDKYLSEHKEKESGKFDGYEFKFSESSKGSDDKFEEYLKRLKIKLPEKYSFELEKKPEVIFEGGKYKFEHDFGRKPKELKGSFEGEYKFESFKPQESKGYRESHEAPSKYSLELSEGPSYKFPTGGKSNSGSYEFGSYKFPQEMKFSSKEPDNKFNFESYKFPSDMKFPIDSNYNFESSKLPTDSEFNFDSSKFRFDSQNMKMPQFNFDEFKGGNGQFQFNDVTIPEEFRFKGVESLPGGRPSGGFGKQNGGQGMRPQKFKQPQATTFDEFKGGDGQFQFNDVTIPEEFRFKGVQSLPGGRPNGGFGKQNGGQGMRPQKFKQPPSKSNKPKSPLPPPPPKKYLIKITTKH